MSTIHPHAITIVFDLQGITSIALYGLGNIRDERLNKMFQVLVLKLSFA